MKDDMKREYKKPVMLEYGISRSPILAGSDINNEMGDQNQLAKPFDVSFGDGDDE